jgi:hypothetical protein
MAKKYFKFPVRFARSVHVRTMNCTYKYVQSLVCWQLYVQDFLTTPRFSLVKLTTRNKKAYNTITLTTVLSYHGFVASLFCCRLQARPGRYVRRCLKIHRGHPTRDASYLSFPLCNYYGIIISSVCCVRSLPPVPSGVVVAQAAFEQANVNPSLVDQVVF